MLLAIHTLGSTHRARLLPWSPWPRRRSTFLGRLKPVSSRLSLLLPAALPVPSEPGAHAVGGPAAARAVLQKGLTAVQASTCKPRWGQSFAFVINSRHQVCGWGAMGCLGGAGRAAGRWAARNKGVRVPWHEPGPPWWSA